VNTAAAPGPLRHFLAQLDELSSGVVPEMDKVGRALMDLAADEEYFAPLIAQIPVGAPGVQWLVQPERGPRLVLVHRPEGVMAYTHSHRCWVAIAPVRGVETHQHWHAVRHPGGRAEMSLTDERARAVVMGDLVPPDDVHNTVMSLPGPSPYSLILLGDDMLLFDREEIPPGAGAGRRSRLVTQDAEPLTAAGGRRRPTSPVRSKHRRAVGMGPNRCCTRRRPAPLLRRVRDGEAASLLLPVLDRPEARTDSALPRQAATRHGRLPRWHSKSTAAWGTGSHTCPPPQQRPAAHRRTRNPRLRLPPGRRPRARTSSWPGSRPARPAARR
jgi:hypothetical protein